jgi:hypothetical protein
MADKEIPRNTWNMEMDQAHQRHQMKAKARLGEIFQGLQNSNHDPRKRLQISKVHIKGDSQSQIA